MNDPSASHRQRLLLPRFERVRDAFETNFRERNEVGAAVAVWVDGELAVNLWGGSADAAGTTTLARRHPRQHLLRLKSLD